MGAKGARGEPKRLESFRLTSQDRQLLQAAAALYGGSVKPWENGFELITKVNELPILLVPQMPPSQWFELWSAGGCQRRCDGLTEMLSDSACMCDPEARECKMTTRISVMLPDLPGIGVWRFESHGFYAATELPTILELLLSEARRNRYPAAALAIELRVVKRDGQTKKFPVAAIRIRETLGAFIGGQTQPNSAIEQRQAPQITAGHAAIPAAPPGQVIDEPPPPEPERTPEESRKHEWDRLIQTEGRKPHSHNPPCAEI